MFVLVAPSSLSVHYDVLPFNCIPPRSSRLRYPCGQDKWIGCEAVLCLIYSISGHLKMMTEYF